MQSPLDIEPVGCATQKLIPDSAMTHGNLVPHFEMDWLNDLIKRRSWLFPAMEECHQIKGRSRYGGDRIMKTRYISKNLEP